MSKQVELKLSVEEIELARRAIMYYSSALDDIRVQRVVRETPELGGQVYDVTLNCCRLADKIVLEKERQTTP